MIQISWPVTENDIKTDSGVLRSGNVVQGENIKKYGRGLSGGSEVITTAFGFIEIIDSLCQEAKPVLSIQDVMEISDCINNSVWC